jgi:hypothetical protein
MLEENTRSDGLAEVGKVKALDQDAKDRGAKLLSVPNFLGAGAALESVLRVAT